MFLENVFPPIPSELIMPLAGFAAARGDLNMAGVIAAGTIGSILGALPWYYAGRWVGSERLKRLAARHGRWMTVSPADIGNAETWFNRHCGKAVLIGRLIPAIRTLISVPASIARMSLGRFLLFLAIGTVVWSGLLTTAGHALESQYTRIADYMDPISMIVIAVIVLGLFVPPDHLPYRGDRYEASGLSHEDHDFFHKIDGPVVAARPPRVRAARGGVGSCRRIAGFALLADEVRRRYALL
jgi:membrane protein DedA with SNARE-associated domain